MVVAGPMVRVDELEITLFVRDAKGASKTTCPDPFSVCEPAEISEPVAMVMVPLSTFDEPESVSVPKLKVTGAATRTLSNVVAPKTRTLEKKKGDILLFQERKNGTFYFSS